MSDPLKTYLPRIEALFADSFGLAFGSTIVPSLRDKGREAITAALKGFKGKPHSTLVLLLETDADAMEIARRESKGLLIAGLSVIEPYRWLQMSQQWAWGTLVTHSLSDPNLPTNRATRSYQATMGRYAERYDPYTHEQLEAVLATQIFKAALDSASGATRQGLLEALERLTALDMGGILIGYSKSRRMGTDQVNLMVVGQHGGFVQ